LQQKNLLELTYPEDRNATIEGCQQLWAGEISYFKQEKRYFRQDGSLIWVNLTISVINDNLGHFKYNLAVIKDIGDRKQAEAEREKLIKQIEQERQFLRTILEQIPAGIIIAASPSGQIILNNEEANAIFQNPAISSDKTADYSKCHAFYLDGKPYQTQDLPIVRAYKKGETITGEEIDYLCGDGIHRIVYVNGTPIYDNNKKIIAGVVVFNDITELKQAQIIKKEAENKAILLKEIHHRVKNNLQIVSTLLDLQSNYVKDEKTKILLQESQTRLHTMALIHEKLYGSQNLENIDFADYIQSLVEYLKEALISESQEIVFTLDTEHIYLNIDIAIPCGLIINELITNSLQHAFNKQNFGEVSIVFKKSFGNNYCLIVSDNGKGLPEEINIEETKSLGLNLVYSLVKFQLEGNLTITKNRGTSWKIEIPSL
jgi:two-component sensor histidine kinase